MKSRIVIGVLALLAAQPAFAATISPGKAGSHDFIPGSGIPGNNFTVDTAATGESVGVQVRSRDFPGTALQTIGNHYYVQTGFSTQSPTSPWWQFDYQFSPGANATLASASNYTVTLSVDFDPAVGAANFATISKRADLSGDFITNVGTWDRSDPFVDANSLNLGFNFWNSVGSHPAFNANTPGEYEIDFSVSDPNGQVVASTQVFAEVVGVPAPPSIVLLGSGVFCGGLSQIVRRLRRR
jgi:hypothetical protein